MSSLSIDDLVDAIFSDVTRISPKDVKVLRADYPQAIGFCKSGDQKIIFFGAIGEHFAEADLNTIKSAKVAGLRPMVVVEGNGMKAFGPHFCTAEASVICNIAGIPTIIDPPQITRAAQTGAVTITRVPIALLKQLIGLHALPQRLADDIRSLINEYKKIARRQKSVRDNAEADALLEFAKNQLIALGLEADRLNGTAFIRSLEKAGLGGRRDHFFHSFQNYFLGLQAVAAYCEKFGSYKDAAHLHWQVDPFAVWFLCTMWHDVGYAHEKVESFLSLAYGQHLDGDAVDTLRSAFIQTEKTSNGIRYIASLMARLLNPNLARTEWTPPGETTRLSDTAKGISNAIIRNLGESHGAFGGVRLYRDYAESIDKMEEDQRQIAQQTVLLAAASMPFHDWKFRQAIRDEIGECRMPLHTLPFAALLAFVDSIQDDRRDLEGVLDTPVVLKSLVCSGECDIKVDVEIAALDSRSILEKIVEGRDVYASFVHQDTGLRFLYPDWIVEEV